MRQTRILLSALAIMAFCALMPGCSIWGCSFGSEAPHDDPATQSDPPADSSLGSLCAAPESGDAICVPSDHDPAEAWNQAAAKGGMPAQMWAKWPSDVELDALIASKSKLKAWFSDLDKVLAYVRDTRQNAEVYRASMAGNAGALLKQAKARQAEILAEKPAHPIDDFKKALSDKASAEKSPLVATIANDKQSMMAVEALFAKAKSDAAPLQAAYTSLVPSFASYRATEAAETAAYVTLAAQASAASLATLDGVGQAVLAAAKAASSAPKDLATKAMTLSAQIQEFELSSQAALLPYEDFLATHGAARPDMTSDALRSINAMLGYVQARVQRSDAIATSLLNGIAMRRQALLLMGASPPVRDKVAQAKLLQASSTFHADADARIAALSNGPAVSASLKLPYLGKRYDELTRLVQMEPLCAPASSSWREAGCASLRTSLKAAETELMTTLPALLKAGLATLRSKGADSALLDAAAARLEAGDVKGAALVYDAALRGSEEGT